MKGDKMTGVSCADNCEDLGKEFDRGYDAGEKVMKKVLFGAFRGVCKHKFNASCDSTCNKSGKCEQDACPLVDVTLC